MLRTAIAAAVLVTGLPAAAVAQAPDAAPVASLIRSFLSADRGLDWSDLDARHEVRWIAGRTMLKTNAPDGGSFARPGVATIGGRTFDVAATGSLAGVGSIYISQATPATPADAIASGLRQAGIVITPVRCPRDAARADRSRGWYHIGTGRSEGHLYIGPLSSGRQGYTLFLSGLPPMTQGEAASFVDCPDGHLAAIASSGPHTGQAGIVAVVEALMRPAGSPARLPWRAPLPAIQWNRLGPQKIARPEWAFGGADKNPEVLDGAFKTPTTEMTVTATGDAGGSNRFYLEGGGHLPRDAVFSALRRDGYSIVALICGKPYTKMSENWFRISAPGKQPAILYRSMSVSTGEPTENYAIRLDNLAPAIQPGQRAASGGVCPG